MRPDGCPSRLYTLRAAAVPGIDWLQLYRRAVAAGCGEIVSTDEERVAASDELLSRSLRELTRLGELAAYAGCPVLADARPRARLPRRRLARAP
jgi:hypothetical protein